jgi:diguanylate cyclase (GGDEF)-like protein
MALSTFADAVASAMHDVGTHRRLQHLAARSAYEAIHDPLTGLSNRSTLLARGNFELRRGSPGRRVALVLLGVDRFRAVNETLNYDAGDELLRLLARRLVESRQDGEILGRLGGDEFALLLSGGSGSQLDLVGGIDPIGRASELAAALAVPTEVSRVTLAVEVSAGVVVADAGACDAAELLRRADVALHQAKRDGRRVMRYDAASDPASTDRLALLAELRDALATTDQLVVDVQPAIDLHTGAPVSAEVLARWRHPRRGLLQPAEFIPPMEHSELASGFTLYVLGMGLRIAAGWATQGIAVPVSVNLCARCLVNPELPSIVAHDLSQLGVPPERLILEMSESVMDGDEGLVRGIIDDVRDRGMQVSVDDFGTGPASLSLLTRFAVDEVKIDRSFVAGMADSPETAAIVRTTVDLARELDLRVVAEGVELPAQRAALMDLGVTVAQGFLFHPPVSVTDATAIVQGRAQLASARSIPIVTASAP